MSNSIIGIDFGTTSSSVAVMQSGIPRLIPDEMGRTVLPSLVVVGNDGKVFVGHSAFGESQKYSGTSLNVNSIKRKIYRPEEFANGANMVSPVVLAALLMAEMRIQAEKYLGDEVHQAVIAVPANFGFIQRQFIKEAALIAGLEPIRLVNEATAAVCMLPHHFEGIVTAADLGGGTFDVSVIEVGESVLEVLFTTGDDELGGDNFTEVMINLLIEKTHENFDLVASRLDNITQQRIREAAEEAKHLLSGSVAVDIEIPFLKNRAGIHRNLSCTVSRREFEGACLPLLKRIESLIEDTRLYSEPLIRKKYREKVSTLPAKHTGLLQKLLERLRFNKGIVSGSKNEPELDSFYSAIWMLGNASRMPSISQNLREQWEVKPANLIGLKAPVALGAARIAGTFMDVEKQLLLLDVTSRAFGTSTQSEKFHSIIPRNVITPTKATEIFTTSTNNQSSISVPILENPVQPGAEPRQIGLLRLDGILPNAAGVPKIEVTFDIDVNGVLEVSAKDKVFGSLVKVRCDDLQMTEYTLNKYHRIVEDWRTKRIKRI